MAAAFNLTRSSRNHIASLPSGADVRHQHRQLAFLMGQQFLTTQLQHSRHFMLNSVQPSNKKTYCTGMNHWIKHCGKIDTTINMELVPSWWWNRENDLYALYSWKEVCVTCYLTWLRLEQRVEPSTAFNYLTAVRHNLKLLNVDCFFIDTSPLIQMTKTGMLQLFRAESTNSEASRRTQPYTIDMIIRTEKEFRTPSAKLCKKSLHQGRFDFCFYLPGANVRILRQTRTKITTSSPLASCSFSCRSSSTSGILT